MAFSLFGKKPSKNETPLVKKVEERQRALREAEKAAPRPAARSPGAAPPPPPADEGADLDFTHLAAPAEPASAPPSLPPLSIPPMSFSTPAAEAKPAPSVPAGLDFSAMAAAVSTPPASIAPPVREAPPRKSSQDVDSILCIEVEESGGHDIPAPIEEGAVLFANGQAEDALASMKEALGMAELGAWKLQVWLMIFDLLQHLARRAEFEELALEFAVKFERSPPLWVDPPPKAPASAGARGGAANIVLSGTLGSHSAKAFEQLEKSADKQARMRLDFSKLQGVEPEGAQLLLGTLKHLRTAKKEVVLSGEAQLVKALRDRAQAGDASVDQSVWLLLLDIYQQLGQMNEFEEAAVDYAVTYEVSPPSYDPNAVKKRLSTGTTQVMEVLPAAQAADDDGAFRIAGEVAGQHEALFAELNAYAADANPVLIDMKGTRRIDFVNAGRLLNTLEKLKTEGKPIVIRGVGEMIVALFAVMGISKVARIIPRK